MQEEREQRASGILGPIAVVFDGVRLLRLRSEAPIVNGPLIADTHVSEDATRSCLQAVDAARGRDAGPVFRCAHEKRRPKHDQLN